MNYNDIPLYNLLPGLLENESDPSRSTAFMLEDILKRLQKLEEHGGGGEGGPAVWGQITGTLSDQSDLQSKLNLKADKTALEAKADKTALDAKADKTYVDVMLESKANRSELDGLVTDNELSSALSTKADKSEIPDVSKLVTKDEVNAQLETKADAFLVKDGDLVLAPPASTVLPAADNIEPVLSLAKITQQNPFSDTQTIGVSKGAWTIKEIITDSVGRIKGRQATFLKVEDQTVGVKADVTSLKSRVDVLEAGGGSDNSMVYTLPDDGILDVRELDLTPGVKRYQIVKGKKDLAGFIQDDGTVFQGSSISRVGFYAEDALVYLDMGVNGDSPTNLDLYLSLKLDNLYNKRYELVWQMQVNKTTKEVVPQPENVIGLYKPKFNLSVEGSLSPTMSLNVPIGLTLVPPTTMMPADYWAPIYPSDYNKDVLSQLFLAPVNNSANSKERLNGKYAAVFTDGERSWAINDIDGDQIPTNPTWVEIVKSKAQLTKETQLTSPFE